MKKKSLDQILSSLLLATALCANTFVASAGSNISPSNFNPVDTLEVGQSYSYGWTSNATGSGSGSATVTMNWTSTAMFGSGSQSGTGGTSISFNITPTLSNLGLQSIAITTSSTNGGSSANGTKQFWIRLGCNMSATATSTNALCNGDATGAVDLTVSGGTAPYTYSWNNSATTEDLSGIAAGTYSVNVTDAKGCTSSASATVGEPAALTTSVSGTNVLCHGGNTGSIDLTVSGGTPGYSFNWSNSVTAEDISGLTAGTYSVTVTDANGCTAADGYTVTEPTALSGSVSSSMSTIYLGYGVQSATLTAVGNGGTPGYSYSWSNGANTASTTVSPTSNTTYTCVITDANGCTYSVSTAVNVIDVRCGKKNDKVSICHITPGNGKQNALCIDAIDVPNHLAHGCQLGSCGSAKGSNETTGVEAIAELAEMNIYPNPNNGSFTIELPSQDAANVVVTSLSGQVVYNKTIEGTNKVSVELSSSANGVYLVHITQGHDTYRTKVTVQ